MKQLILDDRKIIWLLPLVMLLFQCTTEQKISKKTYPRMIGDITFDAEQDDPTFELCSGDSLAIQYYAFDEKP
ncbi:MAG: hypothetical protein AAF847_17700, partial [Bacteroidota bacterium]